MMRIRFTEKMEALHTELIIMSALCEEAIACAAKALFQGDAHLREQVFSLEDEINRKEAEIEKLCLGLILHEQPVGGDLRKIYVAQKMIVDMERIGDQAYDIAEISAYCQNHTVITSVPLQQMSEAAVSMLGQSIDAFVRQDAALAAETISRDEVVDALFDQTKQSLLGLISENPAFGSDCLDVLMIAKYFERIGDHSENIAQQVIYSVTGERAEGG